MHIRRIKVFEKIFLLRRERFHSAGYRAQDLSISGRMLSSELRRFHKTFLTESIYANLATDISWTIHKLFQIISVDYVDN